MFFNVLIPFQSLKWIMKFQPSGFRMISRVREVLLAAIFKTQITATRGLESLMSRQIRIPHTQIRLEQPLIHNCTILQCALHIIELKLTLLDPLLLLGKVHHVVILLQHHQIPCHLIKGCFVCRYYTKEDN